MVKVVNKIKERILSASGSITGALSFLGGYQICHNVCIGLISLLTLFGITVAGMPLLFLTRVAVPFWAAAFALLFLTITLKYAKGTNISGKIILLNTGFLIAGIPFQELEQFNYIFWIIGGILVVFSIVWYFYEKVRKE